MRTENTHRRNLDPVGVLILSAVVLCLAVIVGVLIGVRMAGTSTSTSTGTPAACEEALRQAETYWRMVSDDVASVVHDLAYGDGEVQQVTAAFVYAAELCRSQ